MEHGEELRINGQMPGYQASKDSTQAIKPTGRKYYRTVKMFLNKTITFKTLNAINKANVPA